MNKIRLTWRAVVQLREIRDYSQEKWGSEVASRYLVDLEQALRLIEENPGLLRKMDASAKILRYAFAQHVLFFTAVNERLFLVAVYHGIMDIAERVRELEPTLTQEAEILYRRLEMSERNS